MEEADLLSDRVAIIDHGKIVALDSPTQLKEKVKSSDVIEIEGAAASVSFDKLSGLPNLLRALVPH
jgi:ABC-2 type transport system ATP-binding protein